MLSFLMPTLIIRDMWSENFHILGNKIYLLNLGLLGTKNTRSKTELVLQKLLAYLIGLKLNKRESSRPRLLAMVIRSSM